MNAKIQKLTHAKVLARIQLGTTLAAVHWECMGMVKWLVKDFVSPHLPQVLSSAQSLVTFLKKNVWLKFRIKFQSPTLIGNCVNFGPTKTKYDFGCRFFFL